jgi:hypothetical protein
MAIFNVKVYAIDYCGYESYYTVEANSEEEALERAEQEFCDEYDLLCVGNGEYADMDTINEDGEAEDDTTSINAEIVSADE